VALTYEDLIELGKTHSEDPRQLVNRRSSLAGKSGYLTHLGLTLESPIGQELFDEPQIDGWLEGKAASTARASRTHLRWWQTIYSKLLQAQGLPSDPRERVQAVILEGLDRLGITLNELARKADVPRETLNTWKSGRASVSFRSRAARLEQALELPAGTLTNHINREMRGDSFCPRSRLPQEIQANHRLLSRVRWRLPADFPVLERQEQDSLIARHSDEVLDQHFRHHSRAKKHPYGLHPEKFPEPLRRELDDFLKYKTQAVLPTGQNRHSRGRVRSARSEENWEKLFREFFGWYLLPSESLYREQHGRAPESKMLIGAGGDIHELTLGLFAVPCLLQQHLNWRITVRSSAPSNATVVLIQKLKSLVHPEAGYLTQNPELVERVPERYRQKYYEAHARYLEDEAEKQDTFQRERKRAARRMRKAS